MKDTIGKWTALSGVAILLGSTMAIAEDAPGAGKTVKPSRGNWDTFWFAQNIVQMGLEELGYDVEDPATLAATAVYSSLSQGDTAFTADTVMPNHDGMAAKVQADVIQIGPVLTPAAIQGYLIDKKTADAHNIVYLEDMQRPEIRDLFDTNGDGRAEMIGPSVGWGAEAVALAQFEALDLNQDVHMIQGEYSALVGDVEGKVSAGEPVFLYSWYPSSLTFKVKPGEDLVWLQMKDASLPEAQQAQYSPVPGVVGCAGDADPCDMGWLATENYISVNKDWAAENPAAVAFFEQVQVSLQDRVDQNSRMAEGERSEDDIRRHAEEWIAAHRDEFDGWLTKARGN